MERAGSTGSPPGRVKGGHVSRGRNAFIAGLLLTTWACAPPGGGVEPDNRRVTVEVRNHNALPVDLYALGGGSTLRLGTVHPGMDGTFSVPQNLIKSGSVRLEARPSGRGHPFRSADLILAPGSVIDFIVAPQLFSSTVTLRP
jgi:hypothetical protein